MNMQKQFRKIFRFRETPVFAKNVCPRVRVVNDHADTVLARSTTTRTYIFFANFRDYLRENKKFAKPFLHVHRWRFFLNKKGSKISWHWPFKWTMSLGYQIPATDQENHSAEYCITCPTLNHILTNHKENQQKTFVHIALLISRHCEPQALPDCACTGPMFSNLSSK